jgi:hypothetical protein
MAKGIALTIVIMMIPTAMFLGWVHLFNVELIVPQFPWQSPVLGVIGYAIAAWGIGVMIYYAVKVADLIARTRGKKL